MIHIFTLDSHLPAQDAEGFGEGELCLDSSGSDFDGIHPWTLVRVHIQLERGSVQRDHIQMQVATAT